MRVAIVGAGFGGVAAGIALRRAGIDDFTLYERSHDLGGVWAANTYPGATCDVPSYLYSFSYEQRRDWSRPCSPQPEILDYLHDVARRHRIAERVQLRSEVTAARWDQDSCTWTLEFDGREPQTADALVIAVGQLSRPAWPRIEGRGRFAGHEFHSAEWDHGYDLRDKRVAVIGTGASAIQFVPEIVDRVGRLDVYQRSAPWLLPRRNPEYSGWVRGVIRRVPGVQALRRKAMLASMELMILGLIKVPPVRWALWLWSWTFMRGQLRDPVVRRKAKPDYPLGCKRILFSSRWLPALQAPGVELIDQDVAEITRRGVRTVDGREREVDCIIWGTGFQANKFVVPMQVSGREGRDLQAEWDGGAHAHLGITVPAFPNMFVLYGPNTNLGVGSIIVMLEAQAGYVARALATLKASRAAAMDVRAEAEAAFDQRVQERLEGSIWTRCESWYRTQTGRVTNNWPGFMTEYVRATATVDPADFRFEHPSDRPALEDEPVPS